MKQQFILNIGGTIRLTTYDKNCANIPTSALITLYMNDGQTVIQAQTTASINTTTGEMTFVIGTNIFPSVDLNYKAVWQYVYNGNTYYETQLVDCVLSILSIPITDEDLFNELPSLKKTNYQKSGTAQSATSTTLVDTKALKEGDDYWKGGQLEILGGTGPGQTCDVTGFVQSTGTLSVTPGFSTTPDSTSTYRVVKSFSSLINQCFEKIEQMLYDRGKRDCLIMESSQIRIPLIYLCIYQIALDLREEKDDRWGLIAADYQKLYENAFSSLALDYDEDSSGGVQGGTEAQQTVTSLRIQRS